MLRRRDENSFAARQPPAEIDRSTFLLQSLQLTLMQIVEIRRGDEPLHQHAAGVMFIGSINGPQLRDRSNTIFPPPRTTRLKRTARWQRRQLRHRAGNRFKLSALQ